MNIEAFEDDLARICAKMSAELIDNGLGPISEAHIITAIHTIGMARQLLELADLHQAEALTKG